VVSHRYKEKWLTWRVSPSRVFYSQLHHCNQFYMWGSVWTLYSILRKPEQARYACGNLLAEGNSPDSTRVWACLMPSISPLDLNELLQRLLLSAFCAFPWPGPSTQIDLAPICEIRQRSAARPKKARTVLEKNAGRG